MKMSQIVTSTFVTRKRKQSFSTKVTICLVALAICVTCCDAGWGAKQVRDERELAEHKSGFFKSWTFMLTMIMLVVALCAMFVPTDAGDMFGNGAKAGFGNDGALPFVRFAVFLPAILFVATSCIAGGLRYRQLLNSQNAHEYNTYVTKKDVVGKMGYAEFSVFLYLVVVTLIGLSYLVIGHSVDDPRLYGNADYNGSLSALISFGGFGLLIFSASYKSCFWRDEPLTQECEQPAPVAPDNEVMDGQMGDNMSVVDEPERGFEMNLEDQVVGNVGRMNAEPSAESEGSDSNEKLDLSNEERKIAAIDIFSSAAPVWAEADDVAPIRHGLLTTPDSIVSDSFVELPASAAVSTYPGYNRRRLAVLERIRDQSL